MRIMPHLPICGCLMLLAACGAAPLEPIANAAESRNGDVIAQIDMVDATGADRLLSQMPNIIALDVRTAAEHKDGHINQSVNVDYLAKDFEANLSALDRDAHYLLYCRSGSRSTKALEVMKKLGFKQVTHMASGFNGWNAAALPVSQ